MTVRSFTAKSYASAASNSVGVFLEGRLEYGVEHLLHEGIADALERDIAEAQGIARRALFTDELIRQLAELQAAAFEGALKGIRKRQLMDGEP